MGSPNNDPVMSATPRQQHAEDVRIVVVQCVCGKLKQQGFICDFCYSTEALNDGGEGS